jgi:hypothetical protein
VKKLFVLFAVVFFTAAGLYAQAKQDFTIVNKTGVVIDQVYVTPHSANEWGEDILGRDALDKGEECNIQFHPKENECIWDLKIIDQAGGDIEWESIDLCKATKITLIYEGNKATAEIEE